MCTPLTQQVCLPLAAAQAQTTTRCTLVRGSVADRKGQGGPYVSPGKDLRYSACLSCKQCVQHRVTNVRCMGQVCFFLYHLYIDENAQRQVGKDHSQLLTTVPAEKGVHQEGFYPVRLSEYFVRARIPEPSAHCGTQPHRLCPRNPGAAVPRGSAAEGTPQSRAVYTLHNETPHP